jgi:arabinofuranosyltransferase
VAVPRLRDIALAAAVGITVFLGFRLFYFTTDDAFIAFRYVSNHWLGRGFVWNPPPFLPVEGYTSWLWVALLRVVWGLTGVDPPHAANGLSLAFGYGTLFVVYRLVRRIRLPERLESSRFTLLALVFLGTVTNRTFLAWLSSGLETSLFNFCLILWVDQALAPRETRGAWWVFRVCLAALFTALARPDGLLAVLATGALLADGVLSGRSERHERLRALRQAFPLLGIPAHLAWRRWYYGAWLPNTYYAKYTGAWPESGWRYGLSFVLEYALWIWLLLALVWAVRRHRMSRSALIVVGALLAHSAFYTLVIGGDHFEYRVYSHLIPFFFVSFLWLAARLDLYPRTVIPLFLVFIAASWAIPWTHYVETRNLRSREETFRMFRPVADRFPAWLRFYPQAFDGLQAWLITHGVCIRHQEHKVYGQFVGARLPSREEGARIGWQDRPVMTAPNVGVVGWVFPNVAVIDLLGLNDFVIARTRPPHHETRRMAHERRPPPGYVECFQPNFTLVLNFPEPPEVRAIGGRQSGGLTDQQIVRCEERFRAGLTGRDARADDAAAASEP